MRKKTAVLFKRAAAATAIFAAVLLQTVSASAMADGADCACLINGATGEVIFSKNISKKHAMASTTKIMTGLLALEMCTPDEAVTMSAEAAATEGSSSYIPAGTEVYMRDMVYGLMLNSGNDAAVAIAEHISGGVSEFVDLMNNKAWEIGARNTHFVNPNGLYDDNHYTTASDLALIARYAMGNPEFREIVSTISYEARPLNSEASYWFANHNKMFEYYEGTTGIKTGYTELTGRCLVSSAKRDDMEFIAVTLDDNDDWNDHAEMLDYAFSEHYPKRVVENGMTVKIARVDGDDYNMVAADDFTIPLKENGRCEVELVMHMSPELVPPVNAGEKTGYIQIRCGNVEVGEVDIVSESDIAGVSGMRLRDSFFSAFRSVVKRVLI